MLKIGILLGDDIGLEVVPEAVKVMWPERKRGEPKATQAAQLIDAAVDKVIAEGRHLTADPGGKTGTVEMGDAIARAV